MNDEFNKIIRSYKITLAAMCLLIIFMILLFVGVIVFKLPDIVRTAVADALIDRFDAVEVTN